MLDENIKVEKKETQEFQPIPEDVYTVELFDITSEQRPTYDTRNKPDAEKEYETVFNFQLVLLDGYDGETSLRGRNLFQNFVPSFLYISSKNGKNKLYQIYEALSGSQITPEQEAYGLTGKDLNELIGKQCRVGTVNKTSGEKTYSNIDKWLVAKEQKRPLTEEERKDAKIKPKDDEAEKKAEAQYEGEELSENDIPFDNNN